MSALSNLFLSAPISRYAIRDRTPGIKEGADGSITLYLQSTSPGKDKESNWLPTPKQGQFNMALRCYGPGADHQADLAASNCKESAVRMSQSNPIFDNSIR
jgi:hypothetical protein